MTGSEQEAEERQGASAGSEVTLQSCDFRHGKAKAEATLCGRAIDVQGDALLCGAIKPCCGACLAGARSLQPEIVLLVLLLQTTFPKCTLLVNAPAAGSVIHLLRD